MTHSKNGKRVSLVLTTFDDGLDFGQMHLLFAAVSIFSWIARRLALNPVSGDHTPTRLACILEPSGRIMPRSDSEHYGFRLFMSVVQKARLFVPSKGS
jgi:hypothetical protein